MTDTSDGSVISSICGGREGSNSGWCASYDDVALKPVAWGAESEIPSQTTSAKIIKGGWQAGVRARRTNYRKCNALTRHGT